MTEVCRVPPDVAFNGNGEEVSQRTEEEDLFLTEGGTPRSPRCEAYVMTGDKMLLLNPKISPSYAKARQDQLPPATAQEVGESPRRRGPFDDFPSLHHKISTSGARRRYQLESSVPSSQSAHMLNGDNGSGGGDAGTQTAATIITVDDDHESSVTVHALGRNGASASTIQSDVSHRLQSGPTTPQSPRAHAGSGSRRGTAVESKSEPASPAKYSSTSAADDSPESSAPATPLKEKLRQLDNAPRLHLAATLPEQENDAARRLATRLFRHDGFKKSDIASHLARNNEFGAKVAHEYLQLFNFGGFRLDAAIRSFLEHFCLTGESSERERILVHFSRRYLQCNPSVFSSEDEVHTLTCAILLLNTDLHGPNLRKKMTVREFIDNLSNTGFSYKRDLLKALYSAIKDAPIEWARNSPHTKAEMNGDRRSVSTFGGMATLPKGYMQVPDPDSQVDYKNGWVMRKCVYDSDGKRTPVGRRGWKMFYATVKGMVLYLHKDERGFKSGQYQTFANAVLLHHSLAQRPHDYQKKQHVFRLRTANLGEFLFQTSDPQEVQSWMDAINFVAAAFSSAALPAPVSSRGATFHRPLLPSAPTRLSMPEQVHEHDRKVGEIDELLQRLRGEEAPPLKAKGKPVQDYFFKERYLEQEKERYATYATLLRTKLRACSGTLVDSVDESEAPPDPQNRGDAAHERTPSQDRTSYREAIGWSSSAESD